MHRPGVLEQPRGYDGAEPSALGKAVDGGVQMTLQPLERRIGDHGLEAARRGQDVLQVRRVMARARGGWEQAIQRALLSGGEKRQYFVKFNVDGLLRGDYQSRMNGYAVGRQNGWLSANDIRELENLNRISPELGGDLYLINGNMTKLADAGMFAAANKTKMEERA